MIMMIPGFLMVIVGVAAIPVYGEASAFVALAGFLITLTAAVS